MWKCRWRQAVLKRRRAASVSFQTQTIMLRAGLSKAGAFFLCDSAGLIYRECILAVEMMLCELVTIHIQVVSHE